MSKSVKREEVFEASGAYHRIDDDTGEPYWEVWAAGDKDSEELDPDEPITFKADTFPPGTRIVVLEPDIDSKESRSFYVNPQAFYPIVSE